MPEKEKTGISIDFYGNTVQFDKSVDGVNKALKATKNELATLNKKLKLDPGNLSLLEDKFKSLKQYQSLLTDQVANYKKELDSMSAEDVGSKKWQELTKQMQNAQVELTKVGKDVESVNRQLQQSVSLANKMGEGLKEVSKSTKAAADALAPLSKAAAAAVTAIGAATMSAAANADEINTLAKQYSLTTEQIQKFQLASGLIDVDLSTITKSYSKLTKSMTSNSKDVQEAFKSLNIAVRDSNGELRSVDDVFSEAITALGQISNETEQDSLAMQLFGKSAAELGPLINGGTEQLAEFSKYLEENGLILSQDELDALNDTNDAFDTIKATIRALSQRIALDFAPTFNKVFGEINDLILKFKDKWDELSPTLKESALKFGAIIATLSPLFLAISKVSGSIGGILTKIGGNGGLIKTITSLMNPVGLITAGLAALFATNEDFRNSVINLVNQITDRLQPIIENVMEFVNQYIVPVLKDIGESIVPLLTQVLDTVGNILDVIFTVLEDLWTILEDTGVLEAFGKAFEWVGDVIEGVVGWIQEAFKWVSDLIEKVNQLSQGDTAQYAYDQLVNSGYTPYGSGGFGYQSGGFAPITLNTEFTINSTTAITQDQVRGWAIEMADVIDQELGRRL